MIPSKKKPKPVMRHLLAMESLDKSAINYLLDLAEHFAATPSHDPSICTALCGKLVTHLFFEPSTRTIHSFEIAAKRLGTIVLQPNMMNLSTVKGESMIDTIHTFEKMGTDCFVIRHPDNFMPQFIAGELLGHTHIINAGDGYNQHPTQALLDLLTIRQHKTTFENLSVCIIGDIAHSRVARSLVEGLQKMGTEDIRLVAPQIFMPEDIKNLQVTATNKLNDGLANADVVVALRIQKERIKNSVLPDVNQYFQSYGLTQERMTHAKPDAIVMHPGPINRDIEIDSQVADGPQSVILQQVKNGVHVRMAVLHTILTQSDPS